MEIKNCIFCLIKNLYQKEFWNFASLGLVPTKLLLLTGANTCKYCYTSVAIAGYVHYFLTTLIRAVLRWIIRHVKVEKSESSHRTFHPNAPFFYDGGSKNNKINNYFLKKYEKEIIWIKLVITLNFCDNFFYTVFHVKDVNKWVPYYQQWKPVSWEISLTKKVTY